LSKFDTGNTDVIGTAGGIGAVEGGIVTTMVVIGMPIRGGCMRFLSGMAAVTTGKGNAVADGAEAEIIGDACVITVVGPETKI
jgi:hypothetical protein